MMWWLACVWLSVWLWLMAASRSGDVDVLPPLSLFVFTSKYSLADLCTVYSRPTLTEWLMDYSYTHHLHHLHHHLQLPPPLKNNDAEGLNWRLLIKCSSIPCPGTRYSWQLQGPLTNEKFPVLTFISDFNSNILSWWGLSKIIIFLWRFLWL